MTVAKVVDEDSPDAVFAAHHRNEPAWDHPRYVLHHALRERFHLGVVALGRDRHHYVQSLSTAGLEPALQPQLGEHHAGELRGLLKHRPGRSEEHTSELQSHSDLVCRLLLEQTTTRHSTRFSRGPGAHWPPGMTHCSCTPSTRCLT